MSTEINLEELYNNSVKILTDLIGFRTISGEDNSALINYCEDYLHKLGATSFKTYDDEITSMEASELCYLFLKNNISHSFNKIMTCISLCKKDLYSHVYF